MSNPKAALMPNGLSPEQRRGLKATLPKGSSYEEISQIGEILLETAVEQQLYEEAIENLRESETKSETKVLLNNLSSTIRILKNLPSLSVSHLHTCYVLSNTDRKIDVPEFDVKKFLASTSAMQKAVKKMHENPLPTNATNNRYTNSLDKIANRFLEVFPERTLGSSPTTYFYKLIKYWHQDVLCSDTKDPRRQIRNLIESRKKHTTT